MENEEFKTRVFYLGRDMSYVGRKFKEDIERHMAKFEASQDPQKFCNKLAQALNRFHKYTRQYSEDLLEIIQRQGNGEGYEEAIEILQNIDCKSVEEKPISIAGNEAVLAPVDLNVQYALSQASSVHIVNDELKEEQITQKNPNSSVIELSSSESSTSTIVYNNKLEASTITKAEEEKEEEETICSQETLASSSANIQAENPEDEVNATIASVASPNKQDDFAEFDRETIVNSPVDNHSPLASPLSATPDDSDATAASLTPPKSPANQSEIHTQTQTSCSQVFDDDVTVQENIPPRDSNSDADFDAHTQKQVSNDHDFETDFSASKESDKAVEDNKKIEFFKALEIRPKPLSDNLDPTECAEENPIRSLKFKQKKVFMRQIAEYYLEKKKGHLQPKKATTNQSTESMDIQKDISQASVEADIDDQQTTNSESNDEAVIDDSSSSPKNDDQKADGASEGDLDVTQKADIRTIKWLREGTYQVEEKLEEKVKSQVTSPFKQKPVQPLPETQLSSPADSESTVICPLKKISASPSSDAQSDLESLSSEVVRSFKKKVVQPLSNTQSSDETDIDQESQIVSPFKKKVIQRLSNTQSSDDTDPGQESQVVSPFKKKTLQPLPSSSSGSEEALGNEEESHEQGRKRPLNDESDGDVDFDAQTQATSGSSEDVDSDLEGPTQDPKRRRISKEGSSASDQPNQLDDDGRDDLLEMLDKSTKENRTKSDDSEKSDPVSSQFDLGDSERDNLLNLLTDKEQEEGGLSEGADELLSQDRDELLNLLNGEDQEDIPADQSHIEMQEAKTDASSEQGNRESAASGNEDDAIKTRKFKFSSADKDELLALLSQEGVVSSDESSISSDEDIDALVSGKRSKKRKKKVGKNILSELVEEFEDNICNKDYAKASREARLVSKTFGEGDVIGIPNNHYSNSDRDSDADSILLDVLKEEAVTDLEIKKPEKLKDCKKRALEAYKSLLEDDDDISDLSSDMDDLEMGFADYRARQLQNYKNIELRRRFGIRKDLYVDVEEADVSDFCLPTSAANGYSSSGNENDDDDDDDDQLCDLSTILQKPNTFKPHVDFKTTRKRSVSSSSSSSALSDLDDVLTDREVTASPPSSIEMASPQQFDTEQQDRWVNDLFANIKNSSDDEQSGCSSSFSHDEDASNSDNDKKKKKKIINLPPLEGDSKKNGDGDDESSSSSTDTDSGIKKAPDNLGSSDEEDFVALRRDKASWRQDPLLKVCLSSSDSDAASDEKDARKKRLRKRKTNKPKKGSDSDATASDLEGQKTPTKKLFSSESSGDSDLEIIDKETTPQKPITITDDDDDDTPTKKGKGRRNIRALVEFEDLAEATQRAKSDEMERIKRLQERDKAMESFTQSKEFCSQLSQDKPPPLILDVYKDTQIKIHPKIVERLKPHQREGIKFMWDSCYLSLKYIKQGFQGSGCILAHCMGLGKTLQALALIQALFSYQETKTKHVLVVCPLSTVLNWRNEYNLAYKDIKHSHVKFYAIENAKAASRRFQIVKKWWATGGLLVLGYECFGLLINDQKLEKWEKRANFRKEDILKALVNPGPDLVICDEGHLLRNKQSQRTLALNKLKTMKRIVLTGTPLQNNLLEYYYMVQFVKPDLLGNEKEFKTNFVNPITNGQFGDSTAEDIMFMKKRTHCLHKILGKTVQRVEDTELKGYLPKLVDQAVFVKLSDLQVKLYNTYLDSMNSRPVVYTKSGNINHKNFLADVQILRYICLHPNVVAIAEKNSKARVKEQDVIEDNIGEDEVEEKIFSKSDWSKELLASSEITKLESGKKLMTAIAIVKEATANGDKVLIFSQSYAEMDSLEIFLKSHLNYEKNHDYYRMDGTISPEVRTHMCDKFNNNKKQHFKVFIMSTKVGGLGLNLTAANRVIIMNVNWNPSYDTQSVFRAYRFGQTKPVYVYRLIAIDTMEEKMYQRVVTKLAVAHRVVDKHQITRHYTAADIQEFYSARPCANTIRPIPNVPDDRVLANIIQRYPFVFRWHEHQTLLANRPEEDLDEMQKNAAWEEYEKKLAEPPPMVVIPTNVQPMNGSSLAQPGPSGMQNKFNVPANNDASFIAKRQNLRQHVVKLFDPPKPAVINMPQLRFDVGPSTTFQTVNVRGRQKHANTVHDISTNSAERMVVFDRCDNNETVKHSNGIDELNSLIEESLGSNEGWADDGMNATLANLDLSYLIPHYPDHNYSLPRNSSDGPENARAPASPSLVPRPLFVDAKAPPPGSVTNPAAQSTNVQLRLNPQNVRPTIMKRNLVHNPINLSKKTHASVVQNPAQAALHQKIKKAIVNGGGGGASGPQPVKPIAVQPPLVNISSAPVTTATPTTSTTASPTTNQRSPLQRQMRSFMDHLHKLQKQMQDNGTEATKKAPQLIIKKVGSNKHALNGNVPKMKINGIPVTRVMGTGTNQRIIKRLVPKGPLSPTKRVLTVPSKAGKSPTRNASAHTSDNPLRRKMVANFVTSPHKLKNGAHLVRRNGEAAAKAGLNLDKENIKKQKRPLLRGFHHIAASIDLSKEDRGVALSPEIIKKFKRKGVSINYVSKDKDDDVIKLD